MALFYSSDLEYGEGFEDGVVGYAQDMETFVCRQTLTGHKDDVLSISGLLPAPAFAIGGSDSPDNCNGHPPEKHTPVEVICAKPSLPCI